MVYALYQEPEHIRTAAKTLVLAGNAQGQLLFPHAKSGHVCFRTQDVAEQEHLFELAKQIGKGYRGGTEQRPVLWVNLDEPISDGKIGSTPFNWIEITGEKVYDATQKLHPTGPQMLVYIDNMQDEPVLHPLSKDPRFMLRCQDKSAEDFLGLR